VALAVRARGNRAPADVRERITQTRSWRSEVVARLPAAFTRALDPKDPTTKGKAVQALSLAQPGYAIEAGWAWDFSTPGAITLGELIDGRAGLTSGLNTPTPLVATVDISPNPYHEGWGTLRVYRTDPIVPVRGLPFAVGTSPMSSPTDSVLVGVTRWGKQVRLPLWQTHWMIAGQNKSGKSSATRVLIENLAPWVRAGYVRITFVDAGKFGRGYGPYRPLFHQFHTDGSRAVIALRQKLAEVRKRATAVEGDRAVPITLANPLEVIIVEEAPAFLPYDGAEEVLLAIAQQLRELGAVLVMVSQNAHHQTFPVLLRRQLPMKIAFRVADAEETGQILDGASKTAGQGPHSIPKTDGTDGTIDTRGLSYVDDDGSGAELVRWWYVTEERQAETGAWAEG
jgi:hypothetical protein